MKNPLKSDTSAGLGLLAARVPLGVFLIVVGYWKFQAGVSQFASSNVGNVPSFISHEWGLHYLQSVPYAEMAVGVMLILGLLTRLAGFIGAAMIISFTIGATGWKQPGLPFHPNLIYIGLMLTVFLTGPGKMSLDSVLFKKRSPSFDE
jgi:uncharacterized membrane protein YphA (DoxX/SURF4 family)